MVNNNNNTNKYGYFSWQVPSHSSILNTLRPRQNGRHFADDMFKCIFLNENVWIPIEISLKFVPKGSINNNPALFQIMAWRRPGDKPLSEPMMVSSQTHICVTRPQSLKEEGNEQQSWRRSCVTKAAWILMCEIKDCLKALKKYYCMNLDI